MTANEPFEPLAVGDRAAEIALVLTNADLAFAKDILDAPRCLRQAIAIADPEQSP